MATESRRLDYWRKYFQSANSDIFEVIEHAILVAASDWPKEFRVQRDRIAEKLFTCQLGRCFGCDRVKQQSLQEEEDEFEGGRSNHGARVSVEKESKVNSCTSDREEHVNRVTSNYSYDEAEALTEEIEEEGQTVEEVLRIKEILVNMEDKSDAVLFESLRRLQLMVISVEIIKTTEIGKAVSGLRKHRSREIRHLVRTLIDGWKALVDEWMSATAALTESTPESMNPSVGDNEEGLPSPPLDEGALFATQATMELSQFFDGMDDDGNIRNGGEFYKGQESGRRPSMENHNNTRKQQVSYQSIVSEENVQMRKQEAPRRQAMQQVAVNRQTNPQGDVSKQCKPQEELNKRSRQPEALNMPNKQSGSDIAAGPGRPQKAPVENKTASDVRFQQRQDPSTMQKKPLTDPQDKFKCVDEISVRAKLEVAKRKLHEGYQQAENAKKQRTIQVMDLQDIPKQGLNHRQPFIKQGNFSRQWASGRR
uniref:Transcription elongation factor A protein 3 n=1 Tax=Anthurium amnicola TaxID=1678845 RepID=A0A1D1YW36_9ARAE